VLKNFEWPKRQIIAIGTGGALHMFMISNDFDSPGKDIILTNALQQLILLFYFFTVKKGELMRA
jgi:hypothetical protein